MKLRVNWKLEGTYTVDSSDIIEPKEGGYYEESVFEQCKEAIEDEPFVDVDPVADGKSTIEVVRV
jgi:hypothetical protein